MELICAHSIPDFDTELLLAFEATQAPFRDRHGFLLYLTDASSRGGEVFPSEGARGPHLAE
ncbi:hypothetical protein [Bradyrhizobium jicamae]|nr:hypothetical protein [Bradyrhizobium jicamae]